MSDTTAYATKQDLKILRQELEASMKAGFEQVVTDLAQVIHDLTGHADERFNRVEERLDKLEVRVGSLETQMTDFREEMGLFRREMNTRLIQDEEQLTQHNRWIHGVAAKAGYKICK